jgi:hypothetical protein
MAGRSHGHGSTPQPPGHRPVPGVVGCLRHRLWGLPYWPARGRLLHFPRPDLSAPPRWGGTKGLMALLGVALGGVEGCNRILEGCIGGGEAFGRSGLYEAPRWDWTIRQETAGVGLDLRTKATFDRVVVRSAQSQRSRHLEPQRGPRPSFSGANDQVSAPVFPVGIRALARGQVCDFADAGESPASPVSGEPVQV